MKFGKLIDGKVAYAQLPIEHDDQAIFTSDPEVMLSLGYKRIINSKVSASERGVYKSVWTETDTQIVQTWVLEPYTEEQLKERYRKRTVQYIREKYSTNQEFAILREYMTYGEDCKEAFDEYNNYVEECKTKARAEIYAQSCTDEASN